MKRVKDLSGQGVDVVAELIGLAQVLQRLHDLVQLFGLEQDGALKDCADVHAYFLFTTFINGHDDGSIPPACSRLSGERAGTAPATPPSQPC